MLKSKDLILNFKIKVKNFQNLAKSLMRLKQNWKEYVKNLEIFNLEFPLF